jgi:hypothetical protein
MTLVDPSFRRATKKKPEVGVVVRSVVSRETADRLREMATEDRLTLNDMIARLLAKAVKKE